MLVLFARSRYHSERGEAVRGEALHSRNARAMQRFQIPSGGSSTEPSTYRMKLAKPTSPFTIRATM